MAVKYWPEDILVANADIGIKYDVQLTVSRSGSISTYSLPGARWMATISFPIDQESGKRPRIEALLASLRGGANRLSAPHFGRPIPNGSLRGTPSLAVQVLANQSTLSLKNCNGDLKAGDLIGLPGQVVMIESPAVPVSGAMTVQINPPTRAQHAVNTPIAWSRPPILWVPKDSSEIKTPYRAHLFRPGFSIELVEAYE